MNNSRKALRLSRMVGVAWQRGSLSWVASTYYNINCSEQIAKLSNQFQLSTSTIIHICPNVNLTIHGHHSICLHPPLKYHVQSEVLLLLELAVKVGYRETKKPIGDFSAVSKLPHLCVSEENFLESYFDILVSRKHSRGRKYNLQYGWLDNKECIEYTLMHTLYWRDFVNNVYRVQLRVGKDPDLSLNFHLSYLHYSKSLNRSIRLKYKWIDQPQQKGGATQLLPGNFKLYFGNVFLNWHYADKYCSNIGMSLPNFKNIDNLNIALHLIYNRYHYLPIALFIGLFRKVSFKITTKDYSSHYRKMNLIIYSL